MKFLKDSIIIQLSPIKHLAHSDPSKKLKKIMPYEQSKKRKAKEKEKKNISEELSNSDLVIYESKKKNEGNIKKKRIKNKDLGLCSNEASYILNSKKKNQHIESKQNLSFSLQEHDTKDIEYIYLSNSASPLVKTLNIQDEFIWDIENNVSYNISSDNYSLISSNPDYYSN